MDGAVALAAAEGLLEAVQEHPPVGQSGEMVVEGVMGQALLEGLAFGDVTEDGHGAGHARLARHGRAGQVDGERRGVPPAEQGVVAAHGGAGTHGAQGGAGQKLDGAGQSQLAQGRRRQLGFGPAQHGLPRGVQEVDAALAVERAHTLAQAGGDHGQALALATALLVELGVGEGAGAHRSQGLQERAVGGVEGLVLPAARDHEPAGLTVHIEGHGHARVLRFDGGELGAGAAQQVPGGVLHGGGHLGGAHGPGGVEGGVEQPDHAGPVVPRPEVPGEHLAEGEEGKSGERECPRVSGDGQPSDQPGNDADAQQQEADLESIDERRTQAGRAGGRQDGG